MSESRQKKGHSEKNNNNQNKIPKNNGTIQPIDSSPVSINQQSRSPHSSSPSIPSPTNSIKHSPIQTGRSASVPRTGSPCVLPFRLPLSSSPTIPKIKEIVLQRLVPKPLFTNISCIQTKKPEIRLNLNDCISRHKKFVKQYPQYILASKITLKDPVKKEPLCTVSFDSPLSDPYAGVTRINSLEMVNPEDPKPSAITTDQIPENTEQITLSKAIKIEPGLVVNQRAVRSKPFTSPPLNGQHNDIKPEIKRPLARRSKPFTAPCLVPSSPVIQADSNPKKRSGDQSPRQNKRLCQVDPEDNDNTPLFLNTPLSSEITSDEPSSIDIVRNLDLTEAEKNERLSKIAQIEKLKEIYQRDLEALKLKYEVEVIKLEATYNEKLSQISL
ncbi:hypothetical protein CLU79DRAFT_529925 [Phycomyces nitens]|nr:hypothetical protein CLU79DRAFT_529925 [Phycomyces nitens]